STLLSRISKSKSISNFFEFSLNEFNQRFANPLLDSYCPFPSLAKYCSLAMKLTNEKKYDFSIALALFIGRIKSFIFFSKIALKAGATGLRINASGVIELIKFCVLVILF